MLRIISKRQNEIEKFEKNGFRIIDCTSKNPDPIFASGLSPFYLGPINCYDNLTSKKMENAWQFSKVYPQYADKNGEPLSSYFTWRDSGWNDNFVHRHPMPRGTKPLYSLWKTNGEYQKLDYIEARKQIYAPLYVEAVIKTEAFAKLKELYDNNTDIALSDFDGYDHIALNMSYKDVINCPNKIMGHAFIIGMLLEKGGITL